MGELLNRYEQVKLRINATAEQVGNGLQPGLLAVSKKHSVDKIRILAAAGQKGFGESYVQEGVAKISLLSELSLDWHFIGPIQSNKAKLIAANFNWVHSVDRLKILKLLNQSRLERQSPLNVLLQIKIGDELSKSGASYHEILSLAEAAQKYEQVTFRGLMCIPPPSDDFKIQCSFFQQAKVVFDQLAAQYADVDTLSMGMSNDLEAAIQTGSTMVRIGTDIFGQRPSQ